MKKKSTADREIGDAAAATKDYHKLLSGVVELLDAGRSQAARAVHSVLTTTYWLVGKRLVEHEQKGQSRAPYGAELLKRLSRDLQERLGRGFSERNLEQMRQFFLLWPKSQTLSAGSGDISADDISQTLSLKSASSLLPAFRLSWSHYVRLLSIIDREARRYYEAEAGSRWVIRSTTGSTGCDPCLSTLCGAAIGSSMQPQRSLTMRRNDVLQARTVTSSRDWSNREETTKGNSDPDRT